MTESKELQDLIKAVRWTVKTDLGLIDLKQALEAYDASLVPKPPRNPEFILMVCRSEHAPAFCSPPWGRTGASTFYRIFATFKGTDDEFQERLLKEAPRHLDSNNFMNHQYQAIFDSWTAFREGLIIQ